MPLITEIKMELTTPFGDWDSKGAPYTHQSRHFKGTPKEGGTTCLVSVSPFST
jgi:hypothetical protein